MNILKLLQLKVGNNAFTGRGRELLLALQVLIQLAFGIEIVPK